MNCPRIKGTRGGPLRGRNMPTRTVAMAARPEMYLVGGAASCAELPSACTEPRSAWASPSARRGFLCAPKPPHDVTVGKTDRPRLSPNKGPSLNATDQPFTGGTSSSICLPRQEPMNPDRQRVGRCFKNPPTCRLERVCPLRWL